MYAVDNAFINYAVETITGQDKGWRLENMVFIELLRRKNESFHDLYYYKKNYEIDFVIFKTGKVIELIQVAYDIQNEKTRKRELSALLKGSEELKCNKLTLINISEKETITINDKEINVVPITEWL